MLLFFHKGNTAQNNMLCAVSHYKRKASQYRYQNAVSVTGFPVGGANQI